MMEEEDDDFYAQNGDAQVKSEDAVVKNEHTGRDDVAMQDDDMGDATERVNGYQNGRATVDELEQEDDDNENEDDNDDDDDDDDDDSVGLSGLSSLCRTIY